MVFFGAGGLKNSETEFKIQKKYLKIKDRGWY
jgi:hypothetical protein